MNIKNLIKESIKFKEKNKWTEENGSGFLAEEIISILPLSPTAFAIQLPYTFVTIDDINDLHKGLNLCETKEVLKFLEK